MIRAMVEKVLAGGFCVAEPALAAAIREQLPASARGRVGDIKLRTVVTGCGEPVTVNKHGTKQA